MLLQERSGRGTASGRRLDEGHRQDVVEHERVDGPGRAQDVRVQQERLVRLRGDAPHVGRRDDGRHRHAREVEVRRRQQCGFRGRYNGRERRGLGEHPEVRFGFEAAVAGGIPVVRVLRDSLAGTEVKRITGILNGTCNYLTTVMLEQGREYEDVLAEAQRLGFAEADPTLDVSGMDAAHKAAILSAIAFSADLDFSKVSVSGIDKVSLLDLRLADRLGYRIKLIAEGVLTDDGVVCRVEPLVLPASHPLARVNGSLNTVRIEGDPVGAITLTGPGAGAGPTASAVMGDVAKMFRPAIRPAFGRAAHHTGRPFVQGAPTEVAPFFLRVYLPDQPGALAALTEALAKEGVSVDKLLQESGEESGSAPVVIITHRCPRANMQAALERLEKIAKPIDAPRLIRIEAAS